MDLPSSNNRKNSSERNSVLFRLTSRSSSGEDFISALARAIRTGDIDNIQVVPSYIANVIT